MAELVSITVYTLLVAYTGVGNVRTWAERRLLAMPNERSSHTQPTPSGGGIAIVLSTLFGLIVFGYLKEQLSLQFWLLLSGGALIALISWLDDLYTMQVPVRLGVHGLSALLAVAAVGAMPPISLPLVGTLELGWFGLALALLWVISLVNAYNFMDGIDGLAGAQAVIAGGGWAFWGYYSNMPLVLALGLILAAGNLGFLGYNWPPARIFMGDVGSAFLGYSFAVLLLLAARTDARFGTVGLLLLWPFLFDTLFTLGRRWSRGENLFQAHRSHLYQRLVIAGHSHRTVTLCYAGLALVGALLGGLWIYGVPGSTMLVVVGLPTLALALWLTVRYYETRASGVTLVPQYRDIG